VQFSCSIHCHSLLYHIFYIVIVLILQFCLHFCSIKPVEYDVKYLLVVLALHSFSKGSDVPMPLGTQSPVVDVERLGDFPWILHPGRGVEYCG